MRRSAAPSVIAKKRQEQGKENVAESKSNVCVAKVSIGRRKFKSPVASSTGLLEDNPSALKEGLGSCGLEGLAQRNDSNVGIDVSLVGNDAPLVGRNPSQVLKLMNSGRIEAEGNKATTASDNVVDQSTNSLGLDSVPDFVGKSDNLEPPSVANLKFNPRRSSLSESSSALVVKRTCPEDGRLENEEIARKKHHAAIKQGESLLDGEIVCVEEVPAISKETIVTAEPDIKHLNVSHVLWSGTDRDDRNGRLSESSCTLSVKRSCLEDGELENESLDITRKKHHQGESLLDGKIVCVEELPAILKETIVTGEPESKHLNVSHRPWSNDLIERLESTSSEVKGEQHFHVNEEHDNGAVSLDLKPTKPGAILHGPQRQRPSLHEMNLKVSSKPCQEVVSAEYYSVMYCPRKPNTKRKGPWSDGVIVCQGRSCTLQDLDGKAVTKAMVQGLKDMPEGATLEVGKFEVEVMRKSSSEEFLSGAVYVADKAPQPIPKELPALTPKKGTFKSFKLQQSRDKGPFITQMDALKLNGDSAIEVPVFVDPYIASKLRPHQKDGVKFMYECIMGLKSKSYCGCLLADEMGLGKTLQVITLIWTIVKQGPNVSPAVKRVLVVCPSSLVQNWGNEVHKWLGRTRLKFMTVHAGTTHREAAQKFADFKNGQVSPLLITSYEIMRKHVDIIASAKPGLLVCDEAHRLKNCAGNKTIDALIRLQCRRKILLTGTPVQNDLNEFYAMIDFANPGLLGPLSAFKRIFAEPIEFSQDRTASLEEQNLGKSRSLELQSRTEFCILRRTADINKQYLPTKTELFVFCRLRPLQISLYRIITARALKSLYMCENASAMILSSITSLRKLCSHPQLSYNDIAEGTNLEPELKSQIHALGWSRFGAHNNDVFQAARATLSNEGWKFSGKMSCLYWLLRTVDRDSDSAGPKDRVVVVSNFTRTLDLIQDMCTSQGWKWLRLDGSTEVSKRQPLVDQLNSGHGEVFVFLLSSKAGGTGLNLIGANRLVLFDPDWNPATDSQAIARVWREGQLKPVMIYRLLSTGSIEEKIYQRQIMKGGMSAAVEGDVDGQAKKSSISRHFSKEELRELFTLYLETNCDTFDLISRTKNIDQKSGKTWVDHSKHVNDPALQSAIKSGIVSFVYHDRDPGSSDVPHSVYSCSEAIVLDTEEDQLP